MVDTLLTAPSLASYKLGAVNDWASLIFPRVFSRPEPFTPRELMCWDKREGRVVVGHVFVIDRKFGDRAQWKLPAGHFKSPQKTPPGEVADTTPLDTAVRELAGETGIVATPEAFRYVGKRLGHRGNHWRCFFTADITEGDRDWMNSNHRENEGEEPKFFTNEEFRAAVQSGTFMREHYNELIRLALIIPPL